jgi:hypothetical protein
MQDINLQDQEEDGRIELQCIYGCYCVDLFHGLTDFVADDGVTSCYRTVCL